MKTKIIPFNLETAKKIQAGEINIVALVAVGLLCLIVGFGIGILLHDKLLG